MKEQAGEGCSIAGRVRVNKVAGNIHLSPGRSFQTSTYQNVYELVPYLKEEGHRHDFSHIVHQLAFSGDDEYDPRKAGISTDLKKRLGIFANPLDNTDWKVWVCIFLQCQVADIISRQPSLSTCFNISSKLFRRNSGLLMVKLYVVPPKLYASAS
jgi:hypothetical protein